MNLIEMTKTHKIYINLSASQARKRLKGHGLGVRKVESAGRRQSVVIHTATGQHLRELESLLADAMPSESIEALDIPVENLRNLGPASAEWLHDIGVYTHADLERLGPTVAYRLIRQRHPQTSLNLLWALAAALSDRDWRLLSDQEKEKLRAEIED